MTNKNIIIFYSDQHSNKFIGHNKMIDIKTPYLDKMIEKGVYFKNCYATSPICLPVRTSLFKSEYVNEHKFYGNE